MAHYFSYWKPETVAFNENRHSLGHAASDQFHKVRTGDVLWVVTSEEPGDLVLVGRLKIDAIVGQLEAERRMGISDLWEADYHVFCDSPEEKAYLDLSRQAKRFTFDGPVERLPENFTGQHFQAMRRLDYSTERLLESIWARRAEAVETSNE